MPEKSSANEEDGRSLDAAKPQLPRKWLNKIAQGYFLSLPPGGF